MGWFNREAEQRKLDAEEAERNKNNSNTDDIELKPAEINAKLKKLDTLGDELKTSINSDLDTKLKPMNDFIASLNQQKAENARKVAAEKATAEANAIDWLDNPEEATKHMLAPRDTAILTLAARATKQDALGDKEYYHGDFKSKVDALIASQPLKSQCEASVVENCYKVVLADHITEINEGKLKTRAQAASFDGKGTGGHSGKGSESSEEDVLNEQEKEVAKKFGMTEKEWAAARKEVTYV